MSSSIATSFGRRPLALSAPGVARPRSSSGGTEEITSAPPRRRALQAQHVTVVMAAIGLPLLRPGGPGNTGAVDIGVLAALAASTAWASWSRHRLRSPLLFPMTLLVLGGAVASITADVGFGVVLTLGQDLYVLVWGIVLANLVYEPALLRTATRAIGLSGVLWATVLIFGVAAHLDAVAGITAREGARASLTLGDPNLAANYFLVCLLVLRASRYPRRRSLRWLGCGALVTATVLTGSNGGLVALLVATVLGFVLGLARRRGAGAALVAALVLSLGAGAAVSLVNWGDLALKAQGSVPILRDGIGRQAESGSSRAALAEENARLFLTNGMLGVGPGQTKAVLRQSQAAYVKEAHNDYIASFVERGALGAIAILLLVAALLVRAQRVAFLRLSGPYADAMPRPELLAAAIVAVLISGAFYEVLHFRHVWTLFGIVAGLEIWGRG